MCGGQREENCYSKDLNDEDRSACESLRRKAVLLLEHRSYGRKGCLGKGSCGDSLLMDKSLPMEDGWAQWEKGK